MQTFSTEAFRDTIAQHAASAAGRVSVSFGPASLFCRALAARRAKQPPLCACCGAALSLPAMVKASVTVRHLGCGLFTLGGLCRKCSADRPSATRKIVRDFGYTAERITALPQVVGHA